MAIGPRTVIVACAAAAAIVHAQPPNRGPDPADPDAAVPVLRHRSSFDGYRRDAEPRVAPWRASNDQVREVGGWRVYAREVDEGARGAAGTGAPSPSPAAHPHGSGGPR